MVTPQTRLAAIWLLGVGTSLFGLTVFLLLTSTDDCGGSGQEFACDVARYLGVLSAIIATVHLTAAVGAWRSRGWGSALGAVIALVALVVCLGLREYWSWWFVLPVAAGYFGTLAVLVHALITSWRSRGGRDAQA